MRVSDVTDFSVTTCHQLQQQVGDCICKILGLPNPRTNSKITQNCPNMFSSKTEYVQTCFRCENDPSCQYSVKHPSVTHSLTHSLTLLYSPKLAALSTSLSLQIRLKAQIHMLIPVGSVLESADSSSEFADSKGGLLLGI